MKHLIILSLLISLTVLAAKPSTPAVSCKAVLSYSADEVANARKLSSLVMPEISKSSLRTLSMLRKTSPVLDYVCLGAGPQCAAASLEFSKSSWKGIAVDKNSTVASNFAEKDFMINSSETDDLTMHGIPGANIEFSEVISSKYGNSQQLAAYIQSVQLQSKVPVLLNTEVIGFEVRKLGGETVIVLKTNHDVEIKARNVLVGTGLGVADTKIPTPFYRQMFQQSLRNSEINPALIQTVMNTETFMRALRIDPIHKRKVVMPKEIAIIGNGDGARIAAEELLESFVVLPKDFKIYWIGNDYQTAAQYQESQGGWDRYIQKVSVHYEKNRVQGIPGYAVDAQLLETGRLSFKVEDPKTKAVKVVEVDMAIDSTGYDNQIVKVMNQSLGKTSYKDVKGNLKERNQTDVTIARQIVLEDGTILPIYMTGPSSGPLLTREQLTPMKNRNPVAIYNNVPLTAELAAQLSGVEPYPRTLGERTSRKQVQPAEVLFKRVK